MAKHNVLFICVHNSARSQMAEAFLNEIGGEECAAESAGLEPGTINPIVVDVMQEVGIDLSQKDTRAVSDVWKSGKLFQYVITVCHDAEAEGCPVFPGGAMRLHWPFPDPSKVTGSDEDKREQVRQIRDSIRLKIERWCDEICDEP
jgi:arsenate reductase